MTYSDIDITRVSDVPEYENGKLTGHRVKEHIIEWRDNGGSPYFTCPRYERQNMYHLINDGVFPWPIVEVIGDHHRVGKNLIVFMREDLAGISKVRRRED